MEKYALIVAGGSGTRMGAAVPKQFLPLAGKPILLHTIAAFMQAYTGMHIILVLPEAHYEKGRQMVQSLPDAGNILITTGGETRFDSVKKGLQLVPGDAVCFVHDAVRCLVSVQLICRCFEATCKHGNAVPAIAPADSMRIEAPDGRFHPLDRSKVKLIQTPQTFSSSILKAAFAQSYDPAFTDEASVVEKHGEDIYLVEGEATNIKITTPLDLLVAEAVLNQDSREMRIGGGGAPVSP